MSDDAQDTETGGSKSQVEMIPKFRFDEVLSKFNQLKTEHETTSAALDKLEAKWARRLEKAQSEATEWQAKYQNQALDFSMERVIARERITDPDGVSFIKHQFSQAAPGEDGNKPAFEDWWASYSEQKKTLISAWRQDDMGGAEGDAGGLDDTERVGAKGTQQEDPGFKGRDRQDSQRTFTAQDIQKMSPEEFKANRDAVLADLMASMRPRR